MKRLWVLYTLIGLGAFSISFLLEGWVFLNITQRFWLSFGATCVFESAKIMTIVLHHFLAAKNGRAKAITGKRRIQMRNTAGQKF